MIHFIVWYLSIGVAGAMYMWMCSNASDWVSIAHKRALAEVKQFSMWEESDEEFKQFFPGFLLISLRVFITLVLVFGWLYLLIAALIEEVLG